MKEQNKILNIVMLLLVFLVISFPMLQHQFSFYKEAPLDGSFVAAPDTTFSWKNWFAGEYASAKEMYLKDNFGCRNFFVRLRNQSDYSLFAKTNTTGVVVGKDGYLFEAKYLLEYNGSEYYGDEKIKSRMKMLKALQDTLLKKNIHLLVLVAPNKADYFPEFIPEPYNHPGAKSNTSVFVNEAKKLGVNFIDYNAWFIQNKATSKYPLYPQTGTHWSVFGAYLAFDTLIHRMERESNLDMLDYKISDVELTSNIKDPDGDIEDCLNVLQSVSHYDLAYPTITWNKNAQQVKPNVLVIGDSYWLNFNKEKLTNQCFASSDFWYYNYEIKFTDANEVGESPLKFNLLKTVESKNFILIESTSANIKEMGWGFVEALYSVYCNPKFTEKEIQEVRRKWSEVREIRNDIKFNKEWFNNIKLAAVKDHITLDSCLDANALYIYWERHKDQ
jgi:hypothetical protein